MVSPALTLAHTGSFAQATTSLSSSLAINEVKKEYAHNLEAERICPTFHSSELNAIFFETIIETGCYYDPCLLYTSPSPRDAIPSRMPSSA